MPSYVPSLVSGVIHKHMYDCRRVAKIIRRGMMIMDIMPAKKDQQKQSRNIY